MCLYTAKLEGDNQFLFFFTESPFFLDKSCYLYKNTSRNYVWDAAYDECETYFRRGLLELNTAKELGFIATMMTTTSRFIWLGCNNRPEMGDKIICKKSGMFWNLTSGDHSGYWADGLHGMYLIKIYRTK